MRECGRGLPRPLLGQAFEGFDVGHEEGRGPRCPARPFADDGQLALSCGRQHPPIGRCSRAARGARCSRKTNEGDPVGTTKNITDLAQQIWSLLSTGDPALADLLADDVVVRASGTSPWSDAYTTSDGVVDYFDQVMTHFPNTTMELRDILTSDRRVAYLIRLRIERDRSRRRRRFDVNDVHRRRTHRGLGAQRQPAVRDGRLLEDLPRARPPLHRSVRPVRRRDESADWDSTGARAIGCRAVSRRGRPARLQRAGGAAAGRRSTRLPSRLRCDVVVGCRR